MKLTKEHIGQIVYRPSCTFDRGYLVAIGESDEVWIRSAGKHTTFANNGDWELVEEPKKPSDWIKDRANHFGLKPHATYAEAADYIFPAILDYLDEQAEAKKCTK